MAEQFRLVEDIRTVKQLRIALSFYDDDTPVCSMGSGGCYVPLCVEDDLLLSLRQDEDCDGYWLPKDDDDASGGEKVVIIY